MKGRLISAAVALLLFAGMLFMYDTIVLNIAFAVIGVVAILEGMRAYGTLKNIFFVVSVLVCFLLMMWIPIRYGWIVLFSLLFLMVLGLLFSQENRYNFRTGAATFLIVLTVTGALCSLLQQRTLSPHPQDGIFMMLVTVGMAIICDTFAFTFGKLFGKRKIFPNISPNKTLAGFIAGLCATPFFTVILFWLYAANAPAGSVFYNKLSFWSVLFFLGVGAVGAGIGIVGDLTASLIKRECGIKDFGNLMPGHGGILDRLDSILFTAIYSFGIYYFFIYYF